MSFSDYLENKIVDHVFGGSAYTAPATIYLALFTAVADGEAGTVTEVSTSGTAYARESVAFTVVDDTASNTSDVEFSPATASWGTITHIGLYDASTSGNLLAYAALSASKTIASTDVFRIPAGDLDVTLS
jgi:hypothetical protein